MALLDTGGAPLDTTRTWKVVVNNFMAGGGDDYSTLARGRNTVDTQTLVGDVLEKFVRTHCAGGAELDYKPEGRITRVGGASTSGARSPIASRQLDTEPLEVLSHAGGSCPPSSSEVGALEQPRLDRC